MGNKRKIRPLVITLGGERQAAITELFNQPAMKEDFETPCFSPGVPSRDLRARVNLWRYLREADILSPEEFEILERKEATSFTQEERNGETFFNCLKDLPVSERAGSKRDRSMHFSQEFWIKAKSLNRGRSPLACALAHLIALKKLVNEGFDVILEDNVRSPLDESARRMRAFADATRNGSNCHFRYYGWLGSVPNIKWIYEHNARLEARDGLETMPVPYMEDIEDHLKEKEALGEEEVYATDEKELAFLENRRPGGSSPVWGCYAYWMSDKAYEAVLDRLRSDIGALLWKTNRARHYSVKPIDKVLPRIIQATFGRDAVQITTQPSFFRAPMLTSQIHTKYDPAFCTSTSFQLSLSKLHWSRLWLTEVERAVVSRFQETGNWPTSSNDSPYIRKDEKN